MNNIISEYINGTGMDRSSVFDDPTDLGWLNYRDGYPGDPNYLEHVVRWQANRNLAVTNVFNGEIVSVQFTNDRQQVLSSSSNGRGM